ncbi:N-acyl homoserine lactonase family protein [Pendulispora albinea]|uniref:N-acyl homoserine lactonase family protein n=1 Tax=Pendulispora albinea TaxID=2741071 RepID=A0ABZ2LS03_9BACT
MSTFGRFSLFAIGGFFSALLAACASTAAQPSQVGTTGAAKGPAHAGVRLYALDCGRIAITDIGSFSDAGKPLGKPFMMSDPCFLIRHPRGTLLWDTGLSWSVERTKGGVANPVGREFIDASLVDQLKAVSLSPADITYVGFSHLHLDHTGNANLFTSSTWLMNRSELQGALRTPTPVGIEPASFSKYRDVRIELLDSDHDVFGDGQVRILQTPGHTPGHQSLVVKLERAGTVILSGDLSHTQENWEHHVIPAFNHDRDQSRASIARIEALARETHARFIVQHEPQAFRALPKFPAYLE